MKIALYKNSRKPAISRRLAYQSCKYTRYIRESSVESHPSRCGRNAAQDSLSIKGPYPHENQPPTQGLKAAEDRQTSDVRWRTRDRASYLCRSMSRVIFVPTLPLCCASNWTWLGSHPRGSVSSKTPTPLTKDTEEEGPHRRNHGIPRSPAACRVGWRCCLGCLLC